MKLIGRARKSGFKIRDTEKLDGTVVLKKLEILRGIIGINYWHSIRYLLFLFGIKCCKYLSCAIVHMR